MRTFTEAGNFGTKPAEMIVAFDRSREAGLTDAVRNLRWGALGTTTHAELPRASVFEEATRFVRPADLESVVTAGRDPDDYLAAAARFAEMGIDGVAMVNSGRDMDAFFEFAADHLIHRIREMKPRRPFLSGPAGERR